MKSWMAIRHFATDAMHAAAVMNENEDMSVFSKLVDFYQC